MEITDPKDVARNYNFLLSEMSEMRPHWGDINRLIRPARIARRGLGGDGVKDKRFDSTASNSSRILTFMMQSGTIPKALVWLLYRIPDSDPASFLNQNHRVQEWFHRFSSVVWLILNRSNFHKTALKAIWDAATFHTSAGFSEENIFARGFQNLTFKSLPIGAYAFSEDRYEAADTMYEPYLLTAHQAEQEFKLALEKQGGKLPRPVQKELDLKRPHETFEFLRYVAPRENRNPESHFVEDMPWLEMDIFMGKKDRRIRTAPFSVGSGIEKVRESGHNEFPYWVWRWETQSGELWGTGQSAIAMPAIKLINRTRMKLSKGLDQAVDPGYWVNPDFLLAPPKFQSGMIDYTRNIKEVARAQVYEGRWDWGKVDVDGLRQEIKDIYFSDFMVLPGKNMTAEEVITLRNQLDKFLGPNVESMEFDFLSTQVERAAATALRSGLAPEPPPELEQVETIEPQFLGTLARAQQLNDVEAMDRFLVMTDRMMVQFPEAGDNIDIDEVVKIAGHRLGIPDKVLRDVDAVDAIRAAKRDVVEDQMAQAEALNITKAASQGANAEKLLQQAGAVA